MANASGNDRPQVRATLMDHSRANMAMALHPDHEGVIRLGLIGLGHRAQNVLSKTAGYADYDLVAICDRRPELVELGANYLKDNCSADARCYTDADAMLESEKGKLDAVAILIDADKQAPLICQCLEAGLHVMSEVPLCYTIEDCWKVVTAVERTGKHYLLMEQVRHWGFIRAWHNVVASGVIGVPQYVEGEYIGYYGNSQYFQDEKGRLYTPEQARQVADAKPTWRALQPPITYLPHELSPLLYALQDRVTRVVAMSTPTPSIVDPLIPRPDLQLALMNTEKGAVMKLGCGFNSPVIDRGETHHHWYHIKGTKGAVEWKRSKADHAKLWIDGWQLPEPLAVPWTTARLDAPAAARGSGHGDADFYVFAQFADALLRGQPLELDVYGAVDTAAPAILAAQSIEQDNMPFDVPDFRPGPHRKPGEMPADMGNA